MKNYIFLYSVILSATTSCAQNEYKLSDEMIYHISVEQISNKLEFNEVFEEYIYIPLKKTADYTIGKISQLLATEDRLFVVSDGIYCFDFEGNPIYNISNKGHARNEYILCESVSISDSLLYMYDRGKRQIHAYEIATGKFLYNIPSPSAESIYRIGNGFVVEDLFHIRKKNSKADIEGNSRFFVYNGNMNELQYMAFSEEQHFHYIGFPSALGSDCYLYADYYKCKLYKILPDKVVSYLQIDCEPKYRNTPKEILKAINSPEVRMDDLHGLEHIGETYTHIFGQFTFKGETYQFFFDKKSGHSKIGPYFTTIDGHQIWYTSNRDELFSSSNYLIRYFTPERLSANQSIMRNTLLSASHTDYKKQQIILDCKPEDNPIVVMYKFRSF